MTDKTYIQAGYMQAFDPNQKSSCGYCDKKEGHTSSWIASGRLRTDDYQKLMDRGWRRCGTQMYKWDFMTSCCQPYTIRLDVGDFQISQS